MVTYFFAASAAKAPTTTRTRMADPIQPRRLMRGNLSGLCQRIARESTPNRFRHRKDERLRDARIDKKSKNTGLLDGIGASRVRINYYSSFARTLSFLCTLIR